MHLLAEVRLRSERPGHTLQPTALIHEAYLALIRSDDVEFQDRSHFFATAGRLMRRILIDHARRRRTSRRGGSLRQVEIEKAHVFSLEDPEFVIAFDQSLNRLQARSERACQVVELRVLAGMEIEEIATALGVSVRTVKRDWQTAKLWLYGELYGPPREAPTMG